MAAPQPPRKVNLLDGPGLKAALDDCAREVGVRPGWLRSASSVRERVHAAPMHARAHTRGCRALACTPADGHLHACMHACMHAGSCHGPHPQTASMHARAPAQVVLGSGYEEDVSVTNNKILMGLVA